VRGGVSVSLVTLVVLDAQDLASERDLHAAFDAALGLGEYYGWNWHALRDRLLTDMPRPITVRWVDYSDSLAILGSELCERYVRLFEEVRDTDESYGRPDGERFTFTLG